MVKSVRRRAMSCRSRWAGAVVPRRRRVLASHSGSFSLGPLVHAWLGVAHPDRTTLPGSFRTWGLSSVRSAKPSLHLSEVLHRVGAGVNAADSGKDFGFFVRPEQ